MLLLGYILVTRHKNNIVTLHVTFMLYRRNKTCLLGIKSKLCTMSINLLVYLQSIQSHSHSIREKLRTLSAMSILKEKESAILTSICMVYPF